MELKDYQKTTLNIVKNYLELLDEWKKKAEAQPGLEVDFPAKAWEKVNVKDNYISRKNGLGEPLPTFCLKIPTGGGKTLLAVKTIDLVNQIYLKKRNGLILWVVPTKQIYRQTLQSLKNREHPYRQHLDIASGGNTLILERTDHFTPVDLEENLTVLILMLPAANRQSKETLRMFRDSGNFMDFFPLEDNIEQQEKLLELIQNLDTYGDQNGFWQRQIKTSLGNVLKLQKPLIILDEGHKAYSEGAQKTLRDFNPAMIVELSATPPEESNELVEIFGIELDREQMIKLDLHIINKSSPDWKDTLRESVGKLNELQTVANNYEQNTNNYIRPINVIQAERTGKDQRDGRLIHSEDIKEFLIKDLGISPDEIAIKTSDKDELKEVDNLGGLMRKDCKIRFIITKHALQEGWDCAFAYILTILTNPNSKNALTQLVGRILRQPYARKTKIKALDESYVYCFQQRGINLLGQIRKGFGDEGLGDLAGQVVADEMSDDSKKELEPRLFEIQEKFKKPASEVVLPVFVINKNGWQKVNYDSDIASRIIWPQVKIDRVFDLTLLGNDEKDYEQRTALSVSITNLIELKEVIKLRTGGFKLDPVFFARQILDIVPNPWIAYELASRALAGLLVKNEEKLVTNNFIFIIEELRKILQAEKDKSAKKVFDELVSKNEIRFLVISKEGFRFPEEIVVKGRPLTSQSGYSLLQRSLFESYPENQFNEVEKAVAWYLEDQNKLFFWYRNMPRSDYFVQGWKNQKVYPDFIFTTTNDEKNFEKVFMVETKGLHLAGSEDTEYKKDLFNRCNELAKEKGWNELGLAFKDKEIRFEVISERDWQAKINELVV